MLIFLAEIIYIIYWEQMGNFKTPKRQLLIYFAITFLPVIIPSQFLATTFVLTLNHIFFCIEKACFSSALLVAWFWYNANNLIWNSILLLTYNLAPIDIENAIHNCLSRPVIQIVFGTQRAHWHQRIINQ